MPHFTSQGRKIFYREQGSGPLIVLLHGNTASSACHTGELEYFGKRFRVVAMDGPGVGQSERISDWPHHWWLQVAHDAAALVEHLGCGAAVFMGTSGGGVASLLAAIHHGKLVRAVIADSCVENWTPDEVSRLTDSRSKISLGQIAFWRNAHGDDWQTVVAADTAMIRSWQDSGICFFDGRLGEIRCPVLLTDSLGDDLLPRVDEEVRRMAREIPDCRTLLVTDGRHPMMWSRAADSRRAADEFLATLPAEA